MATILIVDDDQQILIVISRMLQKAGYETLTASSGNETLKIYKQKKPDLLIIDIVMPEKEGTETIMELKSLNPGVKIIAMSGGGRIGPETYLHVARLLGAGEALEKPIERDALLSAVRRVLSDKPQ